MAKSKIDWTDKVWNPTTGCSPVDWGCLHCYAKRITEQLKEMGKEKYVHGFIPIAHPNTLDIPRRWKKPCKIFVNSMGDLFHPEIDIRFIKDVFMVMMDCPHHTFQVLTRRIDRVLRLDLPWPKNVWMGVTVPTNEEMDRVLLLKNVPAAVRFISFEPLLERITPVTLPYLENGIDWVIVGGESGPKARPMDTWWVHDIYQRCNKYKVPFFFKQWGHNNELKHSLKFTLLMDKTKEFPDG